MPRIVLAPALVASLALLAVAARGPGRSPWLPLGLLPAAALHGLALGWLGGGARRLSAAAAGAPLPDWMRALAVRNDRRARPFATLGLAALGLTAIAGWWLGPGLAVERLWYRGVASVTLGLSLGAFALEAASVAAQRQLERAARACRPDRA